MHKCSNHQIVCLLDNQVTVFLKKKTSFHFFIKYNVFVLLFVNIYLLRSDSFFLSLDIHIHVNDTCSLECIDLQQIKSSSTGMESFIRNGMTLMRKDGCKSREETAQTVMFCFLQRVLRPNISYPLTEVTFVHNQLQLLNNMNLKELSFF